MAEARRTHDAGLEFAVHDVARTPFPVGEPDAMLCRFLLTHLSAPGEVLSRWAKASAPDCVLFIHETELIDSEHPALHRYYELVAQLQRHCGQTLEIGPVLADCVAKSGWRIVESICRKSRKPASAMAQLHLPNLRTWRQDDYARKAFDAGEIGKLEASLAEIAASPANGGAVINAARQIIARSN